MTELPILMAKDCAYAAGNVLTGLFPETDANGLVHHMMNRHDDPSRGQFRQFGGGDPYCDTRGPQNGASFDGTNAYVFHGKSQWAQATPMGFVAPGTGSRSNEALVSFRGSIKASDLFIDLAYAPGTSPKGMAVHGGFARVINSCMPELDRIVADLPANVTTLHFTGHSMGGALATLAAERFIDTGKTPYLYTFGAPRVGMLPHVRYMKAKMGDRISRYYYSGDVVTWVPPFPYVHMPGKRLVTSGLMGAGHNDYQHSRNLVRAYGGDEPMNNADAMKQAEALIDYGMNVGGAAGVESKGMRFLMQALHKILYLCGGILGTTIITATTVIDQVAALVAHFANSNKNAQPLVMKWIKGAFAVMKKVFRASYRFVVNEIVGTLRYILNLMLTGIRNVVQRELDEAQRPRGGQVTVRF